MHPLAVWDIVIRSRTGISITFYSYYSPSYNFLTQQHGNRDASLRGTGTHDQPYVAYGLWPPEFTVRIIQLIEDFGVKVVLEQNFRNE